MSAPVPVFDGHNDVLLRLHLTPSDRPERLFLEGGADGHLDLPRARDGRFVGGLFAVFPPSPRSIADAGKGMVPGGYDLPLPPALALDDARASTVAMVSILHRIVRRSNGAVALCRTAGEIRDAIGRGALATVLHVEGCEAIDTDLRFLDVLHAAGLRSLGPVWSRHNAFGHGVPFRFPSTPDTGPGLTEAGERLVKACNELNILVDLSHITERGFWDVARLSKAPLVASHSNVHALTPSARNLTDRQLDAIRDSDGLVGLNFATCFLRPDGAMRSDTTLDPMIRHLDALIERLGETRVAFGSDFDGALIPRAIGTVAGLPALIKALRAHGYDDALLAKIGTENWLRVLELTIG
ncbi:dipeptidase [Chthonobacter rhizosphaerae]|uniref:dipeptidase n=1 Tax=Chthonobacter rhizosphaerae TaxID=2735553 RepID=UPI0015EFB159|nr:dipeptidase [Chthonobacter rhizosphaerae]